MKKKTNWIHIIACFIFYVSIITEYLVAYQKQCSMICMLLVALYLLFVLNVKEKRYKKYRLLIGVVSLLCSFLYFLKEQFILQILFTCFCFLLGIGERIIKYKDTKEVWKRPFLDEKIKYAVSVLLSVFGTVVFSLLMYYDFCPNKFVEQFAEKEENRFTYPSSEILEYDASTTIQTNLVYDEAYPNSVFDLIYDPKHCEEGVFIWIHGGNYLTGHKEDDNQSRNLMKNAVKEGFQVVSMDYAYMTDYRFPVPIVQLDALFRYLLDHQEELHLNMENICLCGTGSGADIALNYTAAVTNKDYADLLGLHPCLDDIQAVVLVSALYDPSKAKETGLILTDYIACQQYRMYYNTLDLSFMPYKVLDYINSSFPPCIIADGNTGTYVKQAHTMDERLDQLDVYHESLLYDDASSQKELVQKSFDLQRSHFTSAVHGRLIDLLRMIKEE